jgi:predicted nucleic acid-binding protein
MTVVINTSPLNYLIQIGAVDVLHALFGTIHIPQAEQQELSVADAPEEVRRWNKSPPPWVLVRQAEAGLLPTKVELHPGEKEAILLARQLKAYLLVMDGLEGRAAARASGLTVIGALGVLELAAARRLIDFDDALRRLRATSFRASPRLIEEFNRRSETRRVK